MLVVVPGEELGQEAVRILVGAEALGKLGAVLHRLELALRVRIVVGDIRPAVGLGDSHFRQQEGHDLGLHRWSSIRMHRESPRTNVLPLDGLLNEFLGQLGRFPVGQHPAHYVTAKDIQDHVKVKIRPLRWPQ